MYASPHCDGGRKSPEFGPDPLTGKTTLRSTMTLEM